jgi:hypothetical protein
MSGNHRALAGASAALLTLIAPLNTHAQNAFVSARIDGLVWDSLGTRAMTGAHVRLVRADAPSIGFSAMANERGQFSIDSVGGGTWLATFAHPLLDSLRLEPPVVRIDIRRTGTVHTTLAVPTGRALIAASCGVEAGKNTSRGMMYGTVRAANIDAPLDSTLVTFEWTEDRIVKGKLVRDPVPVSFRADAEGRFVACDLPRDRRMRVMASRGVDASGDIEIALPPSGVIARDFLIAIAALPGGAPTTPAAKPRATVRGRIVGADNAVPRAAQFLFRQTDESFRIDSTGRFTYTAAPLGTQTIEIRAIGYSPYRAQLDLRAGETAVLELTLPIVSQQLDRVLVRADRMFDAEARGVQARFAGGMGQFLDAETIRTKAVPFVSDALLGMNGVRLVRATGYNQTIRMFRASGGECDAVLFVDGQRVLQSTGARSALGDVSLDDVVTRDDVAAIEVYTRATEIPAQYLDLSGCGAVVVWTRRTFPGLMPRERWRVQQARRDSTVRAAIRRAASDSSTTPPR